MRESIGGAWLMYIFIVFLFVIVFLLCFAMQYLSAYRESNAIVSCLEEREGNRGGKDKPACVPKCSSTSENSCRSTDNSHSSFNYYGTIDLSCTMSRYGGKGANYDVVTYVKFTIPLLGIDVKIPIKNTSRTIYGVDCVLKD